MWQAGEGNGAEFEVDTGANAQAQVGLGVAVGGALVKGQLGRLQLQRQEEARQNLFFQLRTQRGRKT